MKAIKRVIINAFIIASITFFSTLSIDYPPQVQNIWAAGIAGILAFLTQIRTITDSNKSRPPPLLGMLI